MKFKHRAFSIAIVPFFVFGWAYPPGTEKVILKAMVNELSVETSSTEAPLVNEITNKTFTVSGKAEQNTEVSVLKNEKKYKTVETNSEGAFSFRMPLQKTDTKFEFFIKDDKGTESERTTITVTNEERPAKTLLTAPMVKQLPELPRGCEVTSLAMLLQYAGVGADKMTLAAEVKKDPAKLVEWKGEKYFGNPNNGFVGDMYSFKKPGFGVYNGPIEELASSYLPNRVINLSGGSFEEVLNYVATGHPVWVITTSWFDHVPSKYWETWYTLDGEIQVTLKMHSVLITGYDKNYVYFNDPLDGKVNKKVLIEKFIKGWKQFGNQAISYY
jgi:uncharacterized protein YvpB